MIHQPHRLRRSRDDRFIAGVAGGLAEYFDVDPVLVRMGWVLLTMATVGLAVLLYIGLATMMPIDRQREPKVKSANAAAGDSSDSVVEADLDDGPSKRHVARNVVGAGLIVFGMIILLQQLDVLGSIPWNIVWPAAILLLGLNFLLPSIMKLIRRLRASMAMSANDAAGASSKGDAQADLEDGPSKRHVVRSVVGGIGLLVVGTIILLQQLEVLGSIPWNIVWPVVIVLLGISILLPSAIGSRR